MDLDGFPNFVDRAVEQPNFYLGLLKKYIRDAENSLEFYGADEFKTQSLELEKLKSRLYFLEADLSDLRSFKEQSERDDSLIKDDLKNVTPKSVESPERFEIIEKNMVVFKSNSIGGDNISNNSFNTGDWAKVDIPKTQETFCDKEREFKDLSVEAYAKEVHHLCDVEVDSSVENEVFSVLRSKDVELDSVVHIITQSLLKITPSVILNKREEVIPLLMTAVYLNTKATERDKLLQQLFHLKKRPSASERMTILSGVIGIAKNSGEQMVENEILPQCWLQLTHKHVERRLLVAEACTLLIPYVSSPIRNSLILSMLQQMLEDKEEIVRVQIVKALALLFCYCEDIDKYMQCELLALNTLNDSSNSVFSSSAQILFPVLAKWAFQVGYLSSSLLQKLLHKLNDHIKKLESHVKVSQEVDGICRILTVIDYLLPFLLTSVAYYEDVTSNIEKEVVICLRSDFTDLYSDSLVNPENFIKSDLYIGTVLYEFDKYISDNPNVSWPVMDWMIDEMIPDLLNNLNHIELSQQSVLDGFLNLFAHISIAFGPSFTKYKMRPIIQKKIQNLEQVISSFNQFCPSLNVIPIYVTVLRLSKDFEEISSVLKKFLCALPLCGSPLDCLEVTMKKLCESGLQELVVDSLWSGVVHQRPLVKVAAANLFYSIIGSCNEELLKLKVVGAIVTLASDSDCLVRTATIPALGRLITNCGPKEIHDKAYMQLQTFANDVSLKENHTFSRQLVVTFGNIFVSSGSSFRNDVILPQLIDFSNFVLQMTNQTRKVDMCLALLEAFTHVVYSPLNNHTISISAKNALRNLEVVISENASLAVHHETVLSMIKECENKTSQCAPDSPVAKTSKLGQNVNQGVEEMKQRVTKIFNKPGMTKSNTLSNLPGIFKKK